MQEWRLGSDHTEQVEKTFDEADRRDDRDDADDDAVMEAEANALPPDVDEGAREDEPADEGAETERSEKRTDELGHDLIQSD